MGRVRTAVDISSPANQPVRDECAVRGKRARAAAPFGQRGSTRAAAVFAMGCCISCDDENKGKRIWWMPWKRRSLSRTPKSLNLDAPYAPRYAYEKTARSSTRSSMSVSSRTGDAPTYVVLWDFDAKNKTQLTVRRSDNVHLMGEPADEIATPGWIYVTRARATDERCTGYVPKAFVALEGSLESMHWYYDVCSGADAEKVLKSQSGNYFLVRARPEFASETPSTLTTPQGKSVTGKGFGGKSFTGQSAGKTFAGKSAKRDSSVDKSFIMDCGKRAIATHAISVKLSGSLFHVPIYHAAERLDGGYFVVPTRKFASVLHLMEYYLEIDQNDQVPELPCALRHLYKPKRPAPSVELPAPNIPKLWLEIPRVQIKLAAEIGKGHFAVVHKGTWRVPGCKDVAVAIKQLKKSSARSKRKFLQEAVTMRNLSHNHLVHLYGVVSVDDPCWIVTEFVRDGSLRDYLIKKRTASTRLGEKTLVQVCAQIADAMQYLESKRVIHRDLALRNVLVIEEAAAEPWAGKEPVLTVKVADFGLAHVRHDTAKFSKGASELKPSGKADTVPTKWTAPEALKTNNYTSASDVWSFGVVIHEVFTHGQEPYGLMQHQAVRDYILKKRQILTRHADVPVKVYEMMTKCFKFVPDERPHFNEIFTFFDNYYKQPEENTPK